MVEQLFTRLGAPATPNAMRKGKPVLVYNRKCWRCGGLGYAEKWRHTGLTCYRCGGNGIDPVQGVDKLYTAEQVEKLDARKARLDAKRAAQRAERERVEQQRRDTERAEIISEFADLLSRIDAELEHGSSDILESVRDRIRDQAREPTERQLTVAEKIMADRAAERQRRAAARHVGEIGKRMDFELTLLYCSVHQTGSFPSIYSCWSLFTDANGCKIASKTPPWTLGLRRNPGTDDFDTGQTIKVKATVVKHEHDKRGEPLTYINRPKVIL